MKNFLYKCNYKIYKVLHPAAPWLPPKAIKYLKSFLTENMVGFEWGSGRSTVFFARRVNFIVSVEDDKSWYDKVQTNLKKKGLISKTDYKLIEAVDREEISKIPWNNWKGNKLVGLPPKPQFHPYFQEIQKYPDNYFDFVLIDGRARVACMINAIDKIKKEGILILDNSDREKYHGIFYIFDGWKRVDFSNGLQQTTVWRKI